MARCQIENRTNRWPYSTRCEGTAEYIAVIDDEPRELCPSHAEQGLRFFQIFKINSLEGHNIKVPDCSDPDCEFHHPEVIETDTLYMPPYTPGVDY